MRHLYKIIIFAMTVTQAYAEQPLPPNGAPPYANMPGRPGMSPGAPMPGGMPGAPNAVPNPAPAGAAAQEEFKEQIAPDNFTSSVMFSQYDYDRINRIHEILITKRKNRAATETNTQTDVLAGILDKLDGDKPVVRDPQSIYADSIIYRGNGNGTVWLNKQKFQPGAELGPLKLISVDESSALVTWTTTNPNLDLDKLAQEVESDKESGESLNLTDSVKGEKKAPKRILRPNIISVNPNDRMVTFRIKTNQSFDTARLKIVEGRIAEKKVDETKPADAPVENVRTPTSQNILQNLGVTLPKNIDENSALSTTPNVPVETAPVQNQYPESDEIQIMPNAPKPSLNIPVQPNLSDPVPPQSDSPLQKKHLPEEQPAQ